MIPMSKGKALNLLVQGLSFADTRGIYQRYRMSAIQAMN